MVNKRVWSNNLSLSLQEGLLRHKYPESKVSVKKGKLVWEGILKPTSLSREYKIKLICERRDNPKVYLKGSDIKGIERVDFPHHYKKTEYGVLLCLNYPAEFNYSMKLTDTIIPWTLEWLCFYEIWLYTGECHGGGHSVE